MFRQEWEKVLTLWTSHLRIKITNKRIPPNTPHHLLQVTPTLNSSQSQTTSTIFPFLVKQTDWCCILSSPKLPYETKWNMDFLKPTIGNQVKHLLIILSLFLFSLTIISCAKKSSSSSSDTTTQMGGSIQGVELSLDTVVTTLAGTGFSGSANCTGTSASFSNPIRITTDGTNLYVADDNNHLIRKIE